MQLKLKFWNNRNEDDPLLHLFIHRYKLNLLNVPRENSSIGDLYLQDKGKEISPPQQITHFLDPPFEVPHSAITIGEKMGEISGTFSKDVHIDILFDLLGGFLSALGATAGI